MTRRRALLVLAVTTAVLSAAVNPAGAALRSWSNPPVLTTGYDAALFGSSCVSADFCVTVGDQQQSGTGTEVALIDEWGGASWSVMSFAGPATRHELQGVSCLSTSFCMAVGGQQPTSQTSQTLVAQWDGTTWTVVPSPNSSGTVNSLVSVSCVSTTSCVAVGSSTQDNALQPLTEVWDGSTWTVEADAISGLSAMLNGVSCTRQTFCIAVGRTDDPGVSNFQSLFQEWDGSQWSILPSPSQTAPEQLVEGVSCASETWCVAVGDYPGAPGRTLAPIYTWDGVSWSLQTVLGTATISEQLEGVDCSSRTRCVAVGTIHDYNRRRHAPPLPPLIASWDGTSWTAAGKKQAPPLYTFLAGISCSTITNCAAVGFANNTPNGLISQ